MVSSQMKWGLQLARLGTGLEFPLYVRISDLLGHTTAIGPSAAGRSVLGKHTSCPDEIITDGHGATMVESDWSAMPCGTLAWSGMA